MEEELLVGTTYKHYKGGLYKVLHIAKHTETEELLVIYVSFETLLCWARPYNMWIENLLIDGKEVKRFTREIVT